jgi:hypothetical protein
MTERLKEADNYAIDLEGSLVVCRVWSRPDLSSERGAELAQDKIKWFKALAAGDARGLLLDLSEAPRVTGPRTQEALGAMFSAWEEASKPLAVVAGPAKIQHLQMKRVLAAAAPQHGRLFESREPALLWLSDGFPI